MSKLFKNVVVYILIGLSVIGCLVGGAFAVGEKPFEWMGYADFMDLEGDEAWLDPDVYLGYTAQFNSIEYFEYRIGNVVDGEFVEYGTAVLHENARSLRNIGVNYKVTIVDYYQDTVNNNLWYRVEAVDGYELPEIFVENPYVLYLTNYDVDRICSAPTLTMLPKKGMINGDVLSLKKDKASATKSIELDKEFVPDFFDVTYVYGEMWYGYDLGDVTSWNEEVITSDAYRYVEQTGIILVPVVVTVAYEELMSAKTYDEYLEIMETIPERILEQFSSVHMGYLEEYENYLIDNLIVEFRKTIMVGDVEVPVFVSGNVVGDYELSVDVVSEQTIMDEEFDIKNIEDLIVALDIKLVDAEGNQWQPENNQSVLVSIGVSGFGYKDGTILRLQHKHEDEIYVFDEVLVIDGKVTVVVNGFSIFSVDNVGDKTDNKVVNVRQNTATLEIGQKVILYCDSNRNRGTWEVEDTSGAIYYTVHTQSEAGNIGVYAPWIEIVCLKKTDQANPVTLIYRYANFNVNGTTTTANNAGTETLKLNINIPSADKGKREIYIKDDVNKTGRIIASLCDENGNDISSQLEGALFAWTRNDDMFIKPNAYGDNSDKNDGTGVANSSINIAKDQAGLVEARKNDDGSYRLVTYTVNVRLSDGTDLEGKYTVYYQSEIINAGFESPTAALRGYTFFVNGMKGLYWKTTAPGARKGEANNNLTKDIEIGDVTGIWEDTNRLPDFSGMGTEFGVAKAADHTKGGTQFAELNAEDFGALYQDIISVPEEDIEWEFSHAPRQNQNWGSEVHLSNSMFIILGATENAQKITTQAELEELGRQAKQEATRQNIQNYNQGKESVTINFIYNKVEYGEFVVWYHYFDEVGMNESDNDLYRNDGIYSVANNYGWVDISGSYTTPADQYRTRLFFVSERQNNTNLNGGNLIDNAQGGIYKSYLIEYYEESFDDANSAKTVKHKTDYDQKGEELIYNSVKLTGLMDLETKEEDYLHRILINGASYPYETRYSDSNIPSIYIEKYSGKATQVEVTEGPANLNNYDDYDIVVQVFVRDTVIAIDKIIEWPKVDEKETLTAEQKLSIIQKLNTGTDGGYKTNFRIYDMTKTYLTEESITIKNRTPDGNYLGYIAPDNNPPLDKIYVLEETYATPIEGLELAGVKINVTRFRYGQGDGFESDGLDSTNNMYYTVNSNGEFVDEATQQVITGYPASDRIYLSNKHEIDPSKPGYKVAEIEVTNIYKEKQTIIHYQAVGNGKVAFIGDPNPSYVDTPTETLPFYSGKATGAAVHPGQDAVFIGWYKDPECTQLVEAVDGVWDKTTNTFKPNANIISADEITFYAKFETSSIVINRTNGEDGQTFMYKVHVDKPGTEKDYDIYVSLTCGADGKGSVSVLELGAGTYTVTELTDHSWRFTNGTFTYTQTMTTPQSGKANQLIFNFTGNKNFEFWVNEYKMKENIFNKGTKNE